MRQVFSSARLENVEAVADMLREAGIEVRISNDRSYKGRRRRVIGYGDQRSERPAVWVVRSEDQARARQMLRDAGLFESTRPGEGLRPAFRSAFDDDGGRTPVQRRMLRIKLGLIALIAVVMGLALYRTATTPQYPNLAAGPFDGRREPVLVPVAQAVFARELPRVDTPYACLAVDNADAPQAVLDAMRPPKPLRLVRASHCRRVADEDTGSVHPASGEPATIVEVTNFRPTAPDAGTVEYSAYHHRMWAQYKTFEVRRVDGQWQVTRMLKHVSAGA